MAFGGGGFTAQNKVLPGAYINFVSAARASAELSDRGTAALLLTLPYGPEGVVTSVKADYFEQEALGLFGCSADSEARGTARSRDASLLPSGGWGEGAQRACLGTIRRHGRQRNSNRDPRER